MKVINRGKRSKTLSEVKPARNISKNLQSFLEISPMFICLLYNKNDHNQLSFVNNIKSVKKTSK